MPLKNLLATTYPANMLKAKIKLMFVPTMVYRTVELMGIFVAQYPSWYSCFLKSWQKSSYNQKYLVNFVNESFFLYM